MGSDSIVQLCQTSRARLNRMTLDCLRRGFDEAEGPRLAQIAEEDARWLGAGGREGRQTGANLQRRRGICRHTREQVGELRAKRQTPFNLSVSPSVSPSIPSAPAPAALLLCNSRTLVSLILLAGTPLPWLISEPGPFYPGQEALAQIQPLHPFHRYTLGHRSSNSAPGACRACFYLPSSDGRSLSYPPRPHDHVTRMLCNQRHNPRG